MTLQCYTIHTHYEEFLGHKNWATGKAANVLLEV